METPGFLLKICKTIISFFLTNCIENVLSDLKNMKMPGFFFLVKDRFGNVFYALKNIIKQDYYWLSAKTISSPWVPFLAGK